MTLGFELAERYVRGTYGPYMTDDDYEAGLRDFKAGWFAALREVRSRSDRGVGELIEAEFVEPEQESAGSC